MYIQSTIRARQCQLFRVNVPSGTKRVFVTLSAPFAARALLAAVFDSPPSLSTSPGDIFIAGLNGSRQQSNIIFGSKHSIEDIDNEIQQEATQTTDDEEEEEENDNEDGNDEVEGEGEERGGQDSSDDPNAPPSPANAPVNVNAPARPPRTTAPRVSSRVGLLADLEALEAAHRNQFPSNSACLDPRGEGEDKEGSRPTDLSPVGADGMPRGACGTAVLGVTVPERRRAAPCTLFVCLSLDPRRVA